jgi:hypothetical protein
VIEDGESAGAIHPSLDPALNGGVAVDRLGSPDAATTVAAGAGQLRDPFEYGEILRALGLDLTDHEIAVRWYREQAIGHLVPFPSREVTVPGDVLPEGFEAWELGGELSDIDWTQTVFRSPAVIPGVTTLRRVHGTSDDAPPRRQALHLDLYVDSSGSMPNPQRLVSYPALAGAVLVLSALRAGGRVQVTLWSGAQQWETTGGFTEDATEALRILTGHIGGSTAFPLHMLRRTYLGDAGPPPPKSGTYVGDVPHARNAPRPWAGHPTHIAVLSDSGVDTINQVDDLGNPGRDVAHRALAAAGGGGTLILDMAWKSEAVDSLAELGFVIERVDDLAGLVDAARRFARRTYGPPATERPR